MAGGGAAADVTQPHGSAASPGNARFIRNTPSGTFSAAQMVLMLGVKIKKNMGWGGGSNSERLEFETYNSIKNVVECHVSDTQLQFRIFSCAGSSD